MFPTIRRNVLGMAFEWGNHIPMSRVMKPNDTGITPPATFTARVVRDGKWYVAFCPEIPDGNGQGLTEEEALASLRESILLLLEDRREDARASLGSGEKLVPLAFA